MLNLVKPRYVMPFHGDFKRLRLHAQLAEAVGRRARGRLPGRQRPAAGHRRARRALRRARAGRDDLRRRRRDRRHGRRRAARPADALGRRHLHRRRDDRRAGRALGGRSGGDLPRRAVHGPGRRAGRGDPRDRRGLAEARGRARRSARSTCSSRCCTTTSRSSSTTGSGGGRWCCRSSSRSERRRVGASGRSTTKRGAVRLVIAPSVDRAAVGLGDGADDRQARARTSRRGRRRRGRSARTASGASSGGTPGPSSSTISSRLAAPHRDGRWRPGSRVPGGVWRTAFSIRLIVRRWSSSRDALHEQPAGRRARGRGRRSPARARRPPRPRSAPDRTARARPRAPRRCAPAAAGRPTSRRIRREERSAERAASACSPWSESASSSRLASTLVSGVRSSCEASATNWRWRASIASVSPRAASSSRSIPSSVRASSATSSSASGWGIVRGGVAGARDLLGGCR